MEGIENLKLGLVRRGYSSSGGAEAYLFRLAGALRQAGAEVSLFCSMEWPEGVWPDGRMIRLPGRSPLEFSHQVRAARRPGELLLSLERVAGCDIYRAGDGVHAAWLECRKVLDFSGRTLFRRWNPKHRQILALEREIFLPGGAGRIIANSTLIRDQILEFYPGSGDRIVVVPNGYDPPLEEEVDRPEVRAELGLAPDDAVGLFVGSGWERKGLAYAVKAAAGMPSLRLLVAGRGRLGFKAPANVLLLGSRKDLPRLYAAADFFVLPTLYEPFSNACLEAFAHGLPVITTKSNGFAQVLTHPEFGSVLEDGRDIGVLQDAFQTWARESGAGSARERRRQAARQYSMDTNLRATLEVVQGLVRDRLDA